MKLMLTLLLFLSSISICEAQWEIRGNDFVCSNSPATNQLYYNGVLNTSPVEWSVVSLNANNVVTQSNISNSSITLSFVSAGNGCSSTIPGQQCCYPPKVSLHVKDPNSIGSLLASRPLYLGCNYPISGPNSIASGSLAYYQIGIAIVNAGIQCCGYTVWVPSENLEIVSPFNPFNASKVQVQRIGPGQAYIDFYICDGFAYRKTIQ